MYCSKKILSGSQKWHKFKWSYTVELIQKEKAVYSVAEYILLD